MGNLISAHTVLKNKYKTINLPGDWVRYIGLPEENFRMIVYGPSGSGKTTFVMKLCKDLTELGKVYYNSSEQGEGKSIQDSFNRCNIHECPKGSFMLGDRHTFQEMVAVLSKKRSAPFVVIDSLQYMNLTKGQYQELIERFPKKAFIIISWSAGATPKGEHAKGIEYMVDIKTYVADGVAISKSRFGATDPFEVYPPRQVKPSKNKEATQLSLLDNG